MDKKTFLKKMPPLRLAVYLFCAAMFVAMTAITAVRAANDALTESMVVMVGNAVMWLLPFVCRPLFKDKISDGVYAFAAVYVFFASFLGTIMGFYGRLWWYDMAMHTLFGYVGGHDRAVFRLQALGHAKALARVRRPLLLRRFHDVRRALGGL